MVRVLSGLVLLMFASAGWCGSHASAQSDPSVQPQSETFDDWVTRYRARALAAGISAATFDTALNDVRYNARVVELDANQALMGPCAGIRRFWMQ